MNFTIRSIFYIIIGSIILTQALSAFNHNKNLNLKSKSSRKVVNLLADKFIEYFELEKKLVADNYFENEENFFSNENEKCQNVDKINDYFFEVYSEKKNERNLTSDDLENLIIHQIQKKYKDNEAKLKSQENKCTRKKVLKVNFRLDFHKYNNIQIIIQQYLKQTI